MESCDRLKLFTREHDKIDQNKKYGIGRNVACMREARKLEVKVNVKVSSPQKDHEGPEGEKKYSSTLFLTSALNGGGWLTPLYSRE
jgi:hypothetical protein